MESLLYQGVDGDPLSDAAPREGAVPNVLITGCSSGIGLKTAVTLARHGFRVFATMRDLAKRGPLDAALVAGGAGAEVLQLDVTDETSIRAAVDTALDRAGGLDALINNAGYGIGGFIENLTLEEYRRQFDTNLFGLIAVTKAVLPHMRSRRSGRIVNISSLNGRVGMGGLSAYTASKFAVEGFSEALAFEAGPFGVQTIVVEPGVFKTEIFGANRKMAVSARHPSSPYFEIFPRLEARWERVIGRVAGDPQRVADLILHVLQTRRPRLRYVVGRDARLVLALRRIGGFSAYVATMHRVFGFRRRDIAGIKP